MINFYVEASMIEIVGEEHRDSFPAIGLVCPAHETRADEPDSRRLLGGPVGPGVVAAARDGWDLYVPCENGVLVLLEMAHNSDLINVGLSSWRCYEHRDPDGSLLWLPHGFTLGRSGLHIFSKNADGHVQWDDAEPDWVIEFIHRIRRRPLPLVPPGPDCRRVSLATARHLHGLFLEDIRG